MILTKKLLSFIFFLSGVFFSFLFFFLPCNENVQMAA